MIFLVYVDDMLITGDSLSLIEEAKLSLQQIFKMKDLGELKYFLGIEFARSEKGIIMHQRKYSLELISELSLAASKPTCTPFDTSVKLTTREYDEHTNKNCEKDPFIPNKGSYQRLIGKLIYLTVTRPDISYSIQTLSQ